jgi:alkanesulfonate monooxygenase SsuD/methylene tetrahydromethanopterin reductase-like flavin-dependent oxidoreductase (luciferase family)
MMRFGMRATTTDPGERAALYGAVLDMCEWAETRGCVAATVSEHHGVDDGYLPSPVPLAAAMAGRTSSLPISVAALMLAFYDPVKLAEDMAIVDLLSRGRVSYVIGIGYRDEEFAMFGVDRRGRGAMVERRLGVLRRLLAGEEVELDGRRARITPPPFTPGGPVIAYGGGSDIAARRAGRLGMLFLAETFDNSLEAVYREAANEAGVTAPGCLFPTPGIPLTVFVADDPDRAWAEIGEYMLVDAAGYGRWNTHRSGTASISFATTVAELKAEKDQYQIITPAEASDYLGQGIPLALQPLVGGIPPDIAWTYLETAANVKEPSS